MNNTFFSSRSLARAEAKKTNGKVFDHGADKPTGSRWQVLPGYVLEAIKDTQEQREKWEADHAVLSVHRAPGRNRSTHQKITHVKNANGKMIPVMHKRSKTAAFLAHSLNK